MIESQLIESLKLHEGIRPTPYTDTAGHLTLGIGHNTERPLSMRAMEMILEDDIQVAVSELDRAFHGWRDHNDIRQNVLVEMMFNLGASKLKGFEKMWKALKVQDYELASFHIMASAYAVQVGKRARTLANRMRDGE